MAEKNITIGGQALIEGIMMKTPEKYSVAVRKPDCTIDVKVYKNKKMKFSKIPILRGMEAFLDSLVTGYKCIMSSTEISMGTDYEEDALEIWLKKHFGEKATNILTMIAGVMGGALALVLFMILPTAITGFIDKFINLGGLKAVVEGTSKLLIFLIYLFGISKMSEIKRVFSYHGAEHKTIACYEAGESLTVGNVRKYTRFHPRCGTSFMFLILIVSIIIFSFVPWKGTLSRALLKVIFLPLVLGVSYEILRYTGTHSNLLTKIVSAPGLWSQRLTTNEPDDDMIEVAIASVNAVLPETRIINEKNKSENTDE